MKSKYELTVSEQKAVNDYLESKGLPTNINVTFGDLCLPSKDSDVRSRAAIYARPDAFTTELAPGITLGIPLISANMECVTGVQMAIAIERDGGLGIIPQMLPLKERLDMLEEIGRAECALIDQPLTIGPDKTLKEAKQVMRLEISSLVVVDGNRRPIGILSRRDWKHETNENKLVHQLMGGKRKLYVVKSGSSLEEAGEIMKKHRIEKLPIVGKNGRLIGLFTDRGVFYKDYYPRATRDEKGRFFRIGSIGVGEYFNKERLYEVEAQLKKGIRMLLIDTARAHSVNAREALLAVKKSFPKLPVMIGNVDGPEGAKALFECGADVVKVGIGPGDACTTRETGVGRPQISAIAMCKAIAKLYDKTIVGDGGTKSPGDVAKAIIAGADAVMCGYQIFGTSESKATDFSMVVKGGDLDGEEVRVKIYEGSASFQAQQKRLQRGDLDRMREPEGRIKVVPVTSTLHKKIETILWKLCSTMSYHGVWSVKEMRENVKAELQSRAGLIEGIKRK